MKIRTKISVSFIAAFILVSSSLGLVVGIYTTDLIKKNIYAYLQASSRDRAEHVRTFIRDQKKTAVILSVASVYLDFLKEPVNSKQYPIIKDKIIKRFARTLEADPEIYEVLIIGANGKVVASSEPKAEGDDESMDDYFIEGKKGVFIKDVYFLSRNNKLTYAISAPIVDGDGKVLGVSVLRYVPDSLYSIVENENRLGNTEENFLINKDFLFITPSHFLGESVIFKQKNETQNAKKCFDPKETEYVKKNGYSGMVEVFGSQFLETKDYRNVDVITTHAYIPETDWCLITKIDRSDAMSFRKAMIIILLIIFGIAGLLYLITSLLLSKEITKPIATLMFGVNRVKKDDLDFKVVVDSKDEIGDLSKSFNDMVLAVKQSRADIDKKVLEQTKELGDKTKELEEQKSAILNILEDVDKGKKYAESLARDLEKFKLAVDNASDQIVITDVEGIVVYGNKSVERLTGYTPEEAIGKKAGVLWKIPMPIDYYKHMWDVIKTQKKYFIDEIQNRRKNGEIYTAIISISPVLDDKGGVAYFVAIERDITKEKEIDKAKSEFVSLASHQLRTPMTAISWVAERLGKKEHLTKEGKKYLEDIVLSIKRLSTLVDSLLNVSRIDEGRVVISPKPIEVVSVIKSYLSECEPLCVVKELKTEFKNHPAVLNVVTDQSAFRNILQAIVSNAIEYTPKGGRIEISLFEDKDSKRFTLQVSDTGIGIPASEQSRVFTKFARASNAELVKTDGTGLGMYIAWQATKLLGGNIRFESVENEGTTFFVDLPMESKVTDNGKISEGRSLA